jgi:hypothetical protein
MRLHHDRLGNRPKRVELPAGSAGLSQDLLIALFFVLHRVERTREQQQGQPTN